MWGLGLGLRRGSVRAACRPSGISSVTSGLETPSSTGGIQSIELRKHTMATSGTETPDSSVAGGIDLRKDKDKSLFKVISQEEAKVEKSELVGSAFRYNVSDATDAAAAAARKDKNHVNLIRNQVFRHQDLGIRI